MFINPVHLFLYMPRIQIELPEQMDFVCRLPVRITDINYGNHAGNHSIVAMVHEARVQFLQRLGYGELELEGTGMIMSGLQVAFKAELFYGDVVDVYMAAGEFTRVGFELFYRLEKATEAGNITAVHAQTGMVCYNYALKKVAQLPDAARKKLSGG